MEVLFEGSVLKHMLSKVHSIIPERSTLPVLSNALIETKGDRVYITTTDLDMSIAGIGTPEIKKEGAITLNGKKLFDIVRELPEAPISISCKDLSCKITCGKDKFNMTGTPRDEYPEPLSVKGDNKFNISADILRRFTDKALFATSRDQVNPVMEGALLELGKKEVKLVATDGYKLAFISKKGFDIGSQTGNLLISHKVWQQIEKFSSSEEIEVRFDEKGIEFSGSDTVLLARLMEGKFPDYDSVIPKENDKEVIVPCSELTHAIRRASVFSEIQTSFVKIRIEENKVYIYSSSETGEAFCEVDCKYTGETLEIGYNARFLLEVLSRIETDNVKILLKDSLSPGLFMPDKQRENETLTYLLMPMRIEE